MTNMMTSEAHRYFSSSILKRPDETTIPTINPASMAIPPRVGTARLAAERELGTSNSFLAMETLMIPGIIKKTMVKLIVRLRRIFIVTGIILI